MTPRRALLAGTLSALALLSTSTSTRALVVEELHDPGIFLRTVHVEGPLEQGGAREVAMAAHGEMQRCFREHPLPPRTQARYVMRLLVAPDGHVVAAARSRASFELPALEQCFLGALDELTFAAADRHSSVFLSYSMFRQR